MIFNMFKRNKKLRFERMASGSLSIVLEESMSWAKFQERSKKWIKKLNATLIEEVDSFDERLRIVLIDGNKYWISYDDFQRSITLEPQNDISDEIIKAIVTKINKS